MNDKILLVLDIDETLLHTERQDFLTKKQLERRVSPSILDLDNEKYYVFLRPGLKQFLDRSSIWFDLAIWSNGTKDYLEEVVGLLPIDKKNFKFIFDRKRSTRNWEGDYSKNFKKIKRKGFHINRILGLDDQPSNYKKNYGNLIPIKSFFGSIDDHELIDLLPFLEWLSSQENVRNIDKFNIWKYKDLLKIS